MSLLDCEPGTIQFQSTCIPEYIYNWEIIKHKEFFGGYSLGISSIALVMAIACFIIYKARKSKEGIFFKISIICLILFMVSLFSYGFLL